MNGTLALLPVERGVDDRGLVVTPRGPEQPWAVMRLGEQRRELGGGIKHGRQGPPHASVSEKRESAQKAAANPHASRRSD
jgi:hypothetical protein